MAPGRTLRNRTSLTAVQPMPIIAEDDTVPPVPPERSARRSAVPVDVRASYNYSYLSSPRSPTSTIPSSDGSIPDRKPEGPPPEGIRDPEWIARRGGWYRVMLMALFTVAVVVGLAVGLTLGLRKNSSSSSPPAALSNLFPAGNYTFTTALSSVSTSCTSSASAWRCYPFTLYSPTASNASTATFFWTIAPKTSWSYTISSAANPFAPSFADLPLTLHDANQYTERLTFNLSLSHSSVADGPLVPGDTATTTCWFNSTLMAVTLWTRLRADFPAGIAAAGVPVNGTGADGAFAPWPFRAEIRLTQAGGADVPDCRGAGGERVGADAGLGAAGECACGYANWGLDGTGSGNGTAGGNATTTTLPTRRMAMLRV